MVSTTAALLLALAGSAVARIPSSAERHAMRRARRSQGHHEVLPRASAVQHKSNPNQRVVEDLPGTPVTNSTGGNENAETSTNWSGAVLSKSAATWTGVSTTFVVPTPTVPSGGSNSKQYSASAWVGIDGDTCQTAIWQTGVDFYVQGSSVSYDSWYEWYPDYADDFTGISFSAGDSVTLKITATSKTSGKAVIKNNTKGKQVSKTISNSGYSLCKYDAEWIVEDFEECTSSGSCSLVPLADWGTVTFKKAKATTASGSVGPADATIINMKQDGTVLTKVTTAAHKVVVKHK